MRELGKYQVLGALPGGGGRSLLGLYRGFASFQRLVVLRDVLADIEQDPELHQEFLDEVRVAAAFTHPNIARVYDLEAPGGSLILATELTPGATLAELADGAAATGGPLPLGLLLAAVRDAALAVHYAHTFVDPAGAPRPVVHGALGPSCIVVTFEGMTKLLDFGAPKVTPGRRPGDPVEPAMDLLALGDVLRLGLATVAGRPPEALVMVASRASASGPEAQYRDALELARAIEGAGLELWKPEQSAAFVGRLFARRRAELQELIERSRGKDTTAVMKLGEIFGADRPPTSAGRAAPDLGPEPPSDVTDPGSDAPPSEPTHPDAVLPEDADVAAEETQPGRALPRPPAGDVSTQVRPIPPPPPGRARERLTGLLLWLLAIAAGTGTVLQLGGRGVRARLPEVAATLERELSALPTLAPAEPAPYQP